MKKQMKMLALTLVCLLLPGISGCAAEEFTIQVPTSLRIYSRNEELGFIEFQYDEKNFLQSFATIAPDGTKGQICSVTTDENGRILSSVNEQTGLHMRLTWSSKGNLLSHNQSNTKRDETISWEYNTAGNILSSTLTTEKGNETIFYEYAKDGMLLSAMHYSGETLTCRKEYTCLDDGRLETETLYDQKDRISATAVYEYPEDGSTQVTVTQKFYKGSQITERVIRYTYNTAGYLIEEFCAENESLNMRYEYTYITVSSKAGNIGKYLPIFDTLPTTGILDQMTF